MKFVALRTATRLQHFTARQRKAKRGIQEFYDSVNSRKTPARLANAIYKNFLRDFKTGEY
ncbi:hypothetical protein [Pilibacter termitis]|uniref:hypothetical protein n=1 Tax=Pilibacter termitis TaxID=263852 RepID=UPI0011855A84|nr:hypothetical protein [Pilibacter termitis]